MTRHTPAVWRSGMHHVFARETRALHLELPSVQTGTRATLEAPF